MAFAPVEKGNSTSCHQSMEENIPLKVLPTGINYSSFRRFGKNIFINFGEVITKKILNGMRLMAYAIFPSITSYAGNWNTWFLKLTKKTRQNNQSYWNKNLFADKNSPGHSCCCRVAVSRTFILPAKIFTLKKFSHNDHYDSVLTGILVFSYPVYLLLIVLILFVFIKSAWVLLLSLIIPFTAWSYVQVKEQLDK
jgi:hypothetical protein